MKQLIERSYKAIQKRGLITDKTLGFDFIKKLHEELLELTIAYYNDLSEPEDWIEETIDLITVGIMFLHHNKIDFIKEFENVIIKNETRKDKSLKI